jgi:hypothetical protein
MYGFYYGSAASVSCPSQPRLHCVLRIDGKLIGRASRSAPVRSTAMKRYRVRCPRKQTNWTAQHPLLCEVDIRFWLGPPVEVNVGACVGARHRPAVEHAISQSRSDPPSH